MAYSTIDKHTDYFNTKLWTGTSDATTTVSGVGFQPDFTWIKNRTVADDHAIFDSVRGVQKVLFSNGANAESTNTESLTAFNSDGFVTGNHRGTGGDAGNAMVSWNWKAGTTGSGYTTGSGTSKSYSYSVNTTAGFSIIKYTGNGTSGHTIPHHLGVAPKIVLIKKTSNADSWSMLNTNINLNYYLKLNGSDAQVNDALFNNTAPSTTVFTVDSDGQVNENANEFIAYCFTEVIGYSKFGSYTGNNGKNFIYTGFKPKWCMFKRTESADNWKILDSARSTYNIMNKTVGADNSGAEGTESDVYVDFLSNGIRLDGTNGAINANGGDYIYMAFGQSIVGSNNVPCTAR